MALGASLFFVAASAAGAQGPQVTVYIGSYGQQPLNPPPQAAPTMQGSPTMNAAAALQGEATYAQLAAYERYLLYLSVVSSQPSRGPAPDPSQYFTNGAAVTTVPSAGPGSAYFSNGAEATRLPPPVAAIPTAPTQPPPLPKPTELAPWWWVDTNAPPPTTPPPTQPTAPPPALPPSEEPMQEPAMSFEEWLHTMGAAAQEEEAADESPTIAEAALLAEPSATAYEVRQRAAYALPEKRERITTSDASRGWTALLVGTFAVGLLVGGLAMWRTRAPQ